MLLTALTVLLTSLLSALFLTAAARLLAPRFGFLDRPDKVRKLHCRPTPLGGGLAVFLGVVVGLAVLVTTPSGSASVLGGHWPFLLTMIISGGTITTVGLVDDLRDLPVRWKLLGQLAASLILVAGGVLIDRVELFGGQFYLGLLAAPLTLFWVLGAINSVNLLDGIDGFATVQGILMLSAVAAIAGGVQPHVTLVAVALLGGLLGFLAHNLPPARIFLGDAGSMLIGLMVGVLTIEGCRGESGGVLAVVSLVIWTLPILDTLFSILRRQLSAQPFHAGDRCHVHHRFLDSMGTTGKALVSLAACTAFISGTAWIGTLAHSDLFPILGSAFIIVILQVTGIFGRAELVLLTTRLRALVASGGLRHLRAAGAHGCARDANHGKTGEYYLLDRAEIAEPTHLDTLLSNSNGCRPAAGNSR